MVSLRFSESCFHIAHISPQMFGKRELRKHLNNAKISTFTVRNGMGLLRPLIQCHLSFRGSKFCIHKDTDKDLDVFEKYRNKEKKKKEEKKKKKELARFCFMVYYSQSTNFKC